MARNSNIISIPMFFCLILLTSCKTPVTKTDDAFDLVKKERMLNPDSSFVSEAIIVESMKTEPVQKAATENEWTVFKANAEKKIRLNDKIIKEIVNTPGHRSSLVRKIRNLEIDNRNLQNKINLYDEEEKARRDLFKANLNHQVNQINIEINTLKKCYEN